MTYHDMSCKHIIMLKYQVRVIPDIVAAIFEITDMFFILFMSS